MSHQHHSAFYLLMASFFILNFHPLKAQTQSTLGQWGYALDSTQVNDLAIEADGIAFFKNNEYASMAMDGYTLPGFFLQLKATYQPLKNLKLEFGAHGLVYNGANKYPSYAYQDIATWKGEQYQRGCHVLPYLRAHLQLKSWHLIFGDIYGGTEHGLIAPMYNPELNLTADPEAGFQAIYDARLFHFDAWVNWQSFVFNLDNHQEALTVGFSSEVRYNDKTSPVHFYTPIQFTVQHRGGEIIDALEDRSVKTLYNAAIGFGTRWNLNRRAVKNVNIEADALMHYQQTGHLWAKDTGFAGYLKASALFRYGIYAETGYFIAKDFNTLYGIPYFGSVSLNDKGKYFDHTQTLFLSLDYSRTIAKHYALGVKTDMYYFCPKGAYKADGPVASEKDFNFSVGVFFRANPRFLIKKFKSKE